MASLLQYRRYALPFRTPLRTARGVWSVRQGVTVRWEDAAGGVGYGEAAPVPDFGGETVEKDVAALARLGNRPTAESVAALPTELGALRNALAEASSSARGEAPKAGSFPDYLPVAALLPAGREALARVGPAAEMGFRVFKWKVGVGDAGDEIALLDDLCAALPSGARLRLDANGAWDRRLAERWLERCAERPIEHVEQPCFAGASQGGALEAKSADLLLGLAGDYPTPLALDESLVNEGDIERWIGAGWPGVYVVKPLLLGDLAGALERLGAAKAKVVFSSALETALGARTALRAAFAWAAAKPGSAAALGFGVWPLFADDRFDGPRATPFFYWKDIERINPEATWTALT
ncbi:MAG TPA: o-succinylbenzoate synthase [Opitutaceae bacterium]|nr:o-succinylbenzoate synthase [Opitutaceae bacterium]